MYQIVNSIVAKVPVGYRRLEDKSFIPSDPANTEYQKVLEWIAEGNTPIPAEDNFTTEDKQ